MGIIGFEDVQKDEGLNVQREKKKESNLELFGYLFSGSLSISRGGMGINAMWSDVCLSCSGRWGGPATGTAVRHNPSARPDKALNSSDSQLIHHHPRPLLSQS